METSVPIEEEPREEEGVEENKEVKAGRDFRFKLRIIDTN